MMVLTEYLRTLDIIQSFTIVVGTLQFSMFSRCLHPYTGVARANVIRFVQRLCVNAKQCYIFLLLDYWQGVFHLERERSISPKAASCPYLEVHVSLVTERRIRRIALRFWGCVDVMTGVKAVESILFLMKSVIAARWASMPSF